MSALYPSNPANMARKSKVIANLAAEALTVGMEYGAAVEVPRGAQNISFSLEMSVLDETSGDEDYTFGIQGRDSPDHAWVPIPGLLFTQVVGDIGVDETAYEQLPTAANAPGVRVPRFVRWSSLAAGTTPVATGFIRMLYSAPRGPGIVVDHGVVS